MKLLLFTFLFLTIVISAAKEESNTAFFECQSGSMDYCTGYVDGVEQQSGVPMSGHEYAIRHNRCMTGRGCQPEFTIEP